MTTPNQDDKRSVRTLADLRLIAEPGSALALLLDEVEALREQVLAGQAHSLRRRRENAQAWRDRAHLAEQAIADVLALHEEESHEVRYLHGPRKGLIKRVFSICAHCTDTGDPYHVVSNEWPCPTIRAITPDAPASEAQAPNASAYRDTGRPLHSSSTEQED